MNALAPITGDDPFGEPENDYRLLPHNEDAEQALLGAILVDNAALERCEGLSPDHFFLPVHGRIFEATKMIVDRGQVANPVTLKTFFEADEALAGVGGAGYLARLASSAATILNAGQYAAEVRDLWTRREAIAIADQLSAEAFNPPELDDTAAAIIDRTEKALFDLAEKGRGLSSGPRSLRDVTLSALAIAEAAYKRPGGVVGISTGLHELDKLLGGLQDSDLVVLAGRPAMGKSALATNIAYTAASHADQIGGGAVALFSLEMAGEQLSQRLMGELSGIPSDFIRRGEVQNFEALVRATQALVKAPLYIDDTPAMTISQIRARARALKRRHGIGLVVVDYLQLVRPSFRATADSRVQEVSEVTQGLKALAKELHIPVLALSQLSRKVEERQDKRPLLSDLRESGTIEQDADVVIFIYRDEYYADREKPDPMKAEAYRQWEARMDAARDRAELIVAKHRHGPTGTVNVAFHGPTTKFSDLPEE